ncbi:MAG: hypothetical protein M1830_006590 [Pleopsidium flavum]|nr:MAG: hypothetical protein M1830_006590 [Pleopsidium flavum]
MPNQRANPKLRKTLILWLGLDFGTTTSSISWTLRNKYDSEPGDLTTEFETIQRIDEWPDGDHTVVPTVSYYDVDRNEFHWGHQVQRGIDHLTIDFDALVIRSAKLSLHEAKETLSIRQRLIRAAQALDTEVDDFTIDYLQAAREWAEREGGPLQKSLGRETYAACELRYVLGVPAAWSDAEIRRFVEIARSAGICDPYLVSEPEAAAIVALCRNHSLSLGIGDAFIVCDAGGGTVDLITYILRKHNPLCVDEVTLGEGVLCGSDYLNQRFCELVYDKIKDEGLPDIQATMQGVSNVFEGRKRSFNGLDDRPPGLLVPIPGLRDNSAKGIYKERLLITWHKVKEIFDSACVNGIVKALKRQIEQSREYTESGYCKHLSIMKIILTGGLGRSPYLFRELQRLFYREDVAGYSIEIIEPSYSVTAVADGCVMKAQNPGFVARHRSRVSYGFDQHEKYCAVLHGTEAVTHAEEVESWQCVDTVAWILKRGTPVYVGQVFTLERYRTAPEEHNWIFHERLFTSPVDSEDHVSFSHLRDPEEIETLEVDMSDVPKTRFEKQTNRKLDNLVYRVIHYKNVLTIGEDDSGRLVGNWEMIASCLKCKDCIRKKYRTVLDCEADHADLGSLSSRANAEPTLRTDFGRETNGNGKRKRSSTMGRAREVIGKTHVLAPEEDVDSSSCTDILAR